MPLAMRLRPDAQCATLVYFAEPTIPAPASLAEMTHEEFMNHEEESMWVDEYGWMRYPSGPAMWESGSAVVPVSTMPGWLQPFARNQPASVTIQATRAFLQGGPVYHRFFTLSLNSSRAGSAVGGGSRS